MSDSAAAADSLLASLFKTNTGDCSAPTATVPVIVVASVANGSALVFMLFVFCVTLRKALAVKEACSEGPSPIIVYDGINDRNASEVDNNTGQRNSVISAAWMPQQASLSDFYDVAPPVFEQTVLRPNGGSRSRPSLMFANIPDTLVEECEDYADSEDWLRRGSTSSAYLRVPSMSHSNLYRTESQEMITQMNRFLFTNEPVTIRKSASGVSPQPPTSRLADSDAKRGGSLVSNASNVRKMSFDMLSALAPAIVNRGGSFASFEGSSGFSSRRGSESPTSPSSPSPRTTSRSISSAPRVTSLSISNPRLVMMTSQPQPKKSASKMESKERERERKQSQEPLHQHEKQRSDSVVTRFRKISASGGSRIRKLSSSLLPSGNKSKKVSVDSMVPVPSPVPPPPKRQFSEAASSTSTTPRIKRNSIEETFRRQRQSREELSGHHPVLAKKISADAEPDSAKRRKKDSTSDPSRKRSQPGNGASMGSMGSAGSSEFVLYRSQRRPGVTFEQNLAEDFDSHV